MASTSTTTSPSEPEIKVGDYVVISKGQHGTVKYIGPLHTKSAKTLFAGIELDEPRGKHNGVFEGKQYFKCAEMSGVFVPFDSIRKSVVNALKFPLVPPVIHHTKASELRIEAGQKNADVMSRLSGNSNFTIRTSASRFIPSSAKKTPLLSSSSTYVDQLTTKIRQLTADNERKEQELEVLRQKTERLLTVVSQSEVCVEAEPKPMENHERDREFSTDSMASNLLLVEQQRDELHTKLAVITKELEAIKAEKYAQPLMADLLLPNDYSSEVKSLQNSLQEETQLRVVAEEAKKDLESRFFKLEGKSIEVDLLRHQVEHLEKERTALLKKVQDRGETLSETSDGKTKLGAALQKVAELEATNSKFVTAISASNAVLKELLDRERKKGEVDIQKHQQNINELMNTLNAKKREIEAFKESQTQAEAFRQETTEKVADAAVLEMIIAEKTTQLVKLQTYLDDVDQSFKNCEFELEEAKCEIATLKSQCESLRGNSSAETEKLRSVITQLNKSCMELENKVSISEKNVKNEAHQRKEQMKKTTELQQKLDELTQSMSVKSKEVEDLTFQLESLNAALVTMKADFESKIASAITESQVLNKENDDLRKKFESLVEAERQATDKIVELTKIQSEMTNVKKFDDEKRQALEKELQEANNRHQALAARLEETKEFVENKLLTVSELERVELKKTEAIRLKLKEANEAVAAKAKEVEMLSIELKTSKESFAALKTDYKNKISNITAELESSRVEFRSLKQATSSKLREMEEQIAANVAELSDLQNTMAKVAKLHNHQRQILETSIADADSRIEFMSIQFEELQIGTAEKLSHAFAKAKNELAFVKADKEFAEAESVKLAAKVRDQENALEKATALIEQYKGEIADAITAKNHSAEEDIQKLVMQMQAAEKKAADLATVSEEVKSKLASAIIRVNTLQSERDNLEAERVRLDSAFKIAEQNHANELAELKTKANRATNVVEAELKVAQACANTLKEQLTEQQKQNVAQSSKFSVKYDLILKELSDLKSEKEKSENTVEKLSGEVITYKEQIESMSKWFNEAIANNQKLLDEVVQVKKIIEIRDAEIEQLHTELETLSKRFIEQNALSQAQGESRLKELESAKVSAEAKTAELSKLLEKVQTADQKEICQLQSQLTSFEKMINTERNDFGLELARAHEKNKQKAANDLVNLTADHELICMQIKTKHEKDISKLKLKLKSVEDDLAQEKLARHQAEIIYQNYKEIQTDEKRDDRKSVVPLSEVNNVCYTINATDDNQDTSVRCLVNKIAELEMKLKDSAQYENEAMMQRTIIVELNKKIDFLKELAVGADENVENNVPSSNVDDDLDLSFAKIRDYCDHCEEFTHATSDCPNPTSL